MPDKWSRGLVVTFRSVFAAVFSLILFGVLLDRAVYGFSVVGKLLMAAAFLVLLTVLFRTLSGDWARGVISRFGLALSVMALALFLLQMLFGSFLRFEPQWDLEAIYSGAIHWVETGRFTDYTSSSCHADYFYIFPNNLGGLCFFYALFRLASAVGITDYFAVAMVTNSLLLCGTMVLSACVARRLWSPAAGLFCGALFLLSPPFWFLAPVFYTDALSMIFPVAAWYCCLRGDDTSGVARVVWYLAAGLCGGLGGWLKPTVWILFIAAAIVYALRRQWRSLLAFSLAAVSMIGLTRLALHSAVYPAHLDPVTAEERNLPAEYWLSLGLGGDGSYRQDIFQTACDPTGQQAKKEALRAVLADDLRSQGVPGTLALLARKAVRVFGDGTYASSDFLDDRPVGDTFLRDVITYDGEYYNMYGTLTTGLLAALLLLVVAGVVGRASDPAALTGPVALFGLLLFLLIWESSGRYFVNYIPVIFVTATGGLASWLTPHSRTKRRGITR